MESTPIDRRVIGLVVHQTKISVCALIEHDDGRRELIFQKTLKSGNPPDDWDSLLARSETEWRECAFTRKRLGH